MYDEVWTEGGGPRGNSRVSASPELREAERRNHGFPHAENAKDVRFLDV